MIDYLRGLKYFLYVGKIMNTAVEAVLRHRYQAPTCSKQFQGIVYIADGSMLHGGLSDRLRGCVSLYYIAKKMKVSFKIYFVSPFRIEDYLMPNKYDWLIDDSKMDFSQNTNVIYIYNRDLPFEHAFQERYLIKRVVRDAQNHIYTNIDLGDKCFSRLFHELFKPTDKLSNLLSENYEKIGGEYIAMVYRFQQLLGDFKEGNYPVLKQEKRQNLMEQCKNAINMLHKENPDEKILITSDSITFLEYVKDIDYVSIIEGRVYHMDYHTVSQDLPYIKSFLDLFMLAKAKKIYLVKTSIMYNSGFAKRASFIHNVPYKVLNI